MSDTCQEIAKMIDHSLLRPELTTDDVIHGCEIAKKYHVASVCCRPADVPLVAQALAGSGVKASTVIGFPHGSHATAVKVFEAEQAIRDGAEELDMVLNIGRLRSRDFDDVKRDIAAVVEVAHRQNVLVKVILENAYLTDELKVIGCQLVEQAGADFVKTSTGFAPGGATDTCARIVAQRLGERWGKPVAAVLGALMAQVDLGAGAIGGKDSMSGSFEDLDVPPTLVSFAVATGSLDRVVSPEF